MNMKSDKASQKKSQAAANKDTTNQNTGQGASIEANPAQMKLKALANQGPQAEQSAQLKSSEPAQMSGGVQERVAKILVDQLGVPPSEISMGASLEEDLGADELDVVELTMAVEAEFGVSIGGSVKSVADLISAAADEESSGN